MNNANINVDLTEQMNKNQIELKKRGIGVFVFEDYIFGGLCILALIIMMIHIL